MSIRVIHAQKIGYSQDKLSDKYGDELDLKVGIGRGLEISIEKIAEVADVSASSVKRRISAPSVLFIQSITRQLRAAEGAKVAERIEESSIKRMERMFDRAFRLSERLLAKAEADGDNVSYETLMEIHRNLTQWSAKFLMSEAPKRMHVEGSHEHRVVHAFLPANDVQVLLDTVRSMQGLREPLLIAGAAEPSVIDA